MTKTNKNSYEIKNKTVSSAIEENVWDMFNFICIQENTTKSEVIRNFIYEYTHTTVMDQVYGGN